MHDWQALARGALDTLGDAVQSQGFPTWLLIFDDPDSPTGLRLEFEPDPVGVLGWRAPDDCLAVGMVATGRGRVLGARVVGYVGREGDDGSPAGDVSTGDDSAPTDDAGSAANDLTELVKAAGGILPVRMACVVSRAREVGWWMELPDGATHTDPPGEGRVLDVLFRCLGLPTSPPAEPASEIHSAAWLASVIDGGMSSERRLTWSDIERLHPLARLLSGEIEAPVDAVDGEDMDDDDEELEARRELADLVRISAAAWSWEEIRIQAAEGELEAFVDAELAGWMDEGMFSRWLLSILPSVDQLLEVARPMLVPSAARRLAHALHRSASAQPARSASG